MYNFLSFINDIFNSMNVFTNLLFTIIYVNLDSHKNKVGIIF